MPQREYFKIPPSEFATEIVLNMDVYYQMSPNRFQKIGLKGSSFCESHIPLPLKKNLDWLFLKKSDYLIFVGLNLASSTEPNLSPEEVGQKVAPIQVGTTSLIQHLSTRGLKNKNTEIASNTVLNALKLITENPLTLKLFESIQAIEVDSLHSIAVGFWSVLMARRMGSLGESFFFQIALCSLFHDVGHIDHSLTKKPQSELTPQEFKILESHALRGHDILKSIPGLPSEAATVALQHHENALGTGYPSQLKLNDTHPLARLISVANRFCEIEWLHRKQKKSLQDIFTILRTDEKNFDPLCLKSLENLIYSPT
jgi:response regulator RpfG family c-di-GMP phosphodiesterase